MSTLALTHVSKHYGPVAAVKDASLTFDEGILHLVCGENGAGKSTLLKIAAGIVTPDEGRVVIRGEELLPHTPASALAKGVVMVTQHFALAPALTVLENIALVDRARGGRFDLKALRARVTERLAALGFTLPLDAPAAHLSVAEKQRTEIVRALLTNARVVILDEPTAVLAKSEVDALYTLLKSLLSEKNAVIVVTHKMDEVERFADRVTVMQKGEVRFTKNVPRDDTSALRDFMRDAVREIMGEATSRAPTALRERGEAQLELKSIAELSGANITVHAREIVGIAGIEGNGQSELVQVLEDANADPRVLVGGAPKVHGDIAFVHEDRHAQGLVLEASARENLMLGDFPEKHFLIDRESLQKQAESRAARVAFTRELDVLAEDLSGGNQQKLVVGRALGRAVRPGHARAFVFVHPTRGVDIKASAEIHARILDVASDGHAVLVVSSDADELRALADRILVLSKRALVAEFPPTVTEEDLGAAMLGRSTS